MNDSFRTNVFVRYPPETIGCACIFLSARQLGVCNEGKNVALLDVWFTILKTYFCLFQISLPNRPPWWELFGAKLVDLEVLFGFALVLVSVY